jgi:hypothetical protein
MSLSVPRRPILSAVLALLCSLTLHQGVVAAAQACSKDTLCVGPGSQFSSLTAANAAAREGSVIELAGGTYRETVAIEAKGVTIRSAPNQRAVIDCSGMRPAWGKSCILIVGGDATIADLDIQGAKGSSHNEACLRNEPNTNVTVRNIRCTDSYNGILGAGGAWVIENSEIFGVGAGDGRTHGIYLGGSQGGPCASATLRGVFVHDLAGGHAFKSRCANNFVRDSRFEESGEGDSIDFSDGGTALIEGSLLHQPQGANGNILRHGSESCALPGDVVIRNTKILNDRLPAYIYSRCGRIVFENSPVPANVTVTSR